jgi:hypothetical protein
MSDDGAQTFKMITEGDAVFSVSLPFGPYGTGSDDLLMPAASFVDAWNSLGTSFLYPWPMNLLPDRRLQLTVLRPEGDGTNFSLFEETESDNQWWPLMGFEEGGVWQIGSPITAQESVVDDLLVSVIGGELFVDQ